MGTAAGAAQDYSTRINWFGAGNKMIQQVYDIREARNAILSKQADITETPRPVMNPPFWPAPLINKTINPPVAVPLENTAKQTLMTNDGMQLAGGKMLGRGIQLNEQLPYHPYRVRSDGVFQLAGGSAEPANTYLALQTSSTVPRSGGIGSWQFIQEFVPSIYYNPYSGPPGNYPYEFIFNYDLVTDSVDGYN